MRCGAVGSRAEPGLSALQGGSEPAPHLSSVALVVGAEAVEQVGLFGARVRQGLPSLAPWAKRPGSSCGCPDGTPRSKVANRRGVDIAAGR
jgi:hypothetical protein